MSAGDVYVHVLYDFAYTDGGGREVKITKGEELLVLQKSDINWWQVIRSSEKYPFYAPSCYLDVIGNPLNGNHSESSRDENANIDSSVSQNHIGEDKFLQAQPFLSPVKTENSNIPCSQEENPLQEKESFYSLAFQNPLCAKENEGNYNHESSLNTSGLTEADEKTEYSSSREFKNNRSVDEDSSLPIYANIPLSTNVSPPHPGPNDTPERSLFNNWFEYVDDNGRKYYYHSPTRKVTWKPPRRFEHVSYPCGNEENSNIEDSSEKIPTPPPKQLKPKLKKLAHSSTESLDSSMPSCMFTILPPGWTQECDIETGLVYYRNEVVHKKWYTSQDENGRTYFYDEDSSESLWELPEVSQLDTEDAKCSNMVLKTGPSDKSDFTTSHIIVPDSSSSVESSPKLRVKKVPKLPVCVPRQFKAQSMVISENISIPGSEDERNFSPCSLGHTLHAGQLNKTKLVEGGRRVRKNWATSYVVLTDVFLLFYKDGRAANSSPSVKPDFSIDLNGALIDWCPDKSSRKNVFQISTITGHQLLLQHDDPKEMKDWFSAIHDAILKLPTSLEHVGARSEEKENSRHEVKLTRSKSTKPCHCLKNSTEDANVMIPAEKKRKIRDKLKNFFVRRPTMESLREKGIILDEPVFGCLLENLCQREGQKVPKFVIKCIETIEKKELTADGLYRASGNLSQVQKIRFHVNQDDYKCLDDEDDVHVLTGALKMFFREMKEPLFTFQMFNKFLNAIALPDIQSRLKALKDLVHQMPQPNYETLKFLLRHLLRVTEFHKQNRMQIQNLAIVFGPTLMWPEEESTNIALDMMHQNRIVEFLLLEFDSVFK